MVRLPNTRFHHIPRIEHGRRSRTKGVVIHVADGSMGSVLNWFSDPRAKGVGAHIVVGLKQAVQMADLDKLCWHAAGANSEWIGIEHEGLGGQSYARWASRRTQRKLSANRTAWILYHYKCGRPKWGVNVKPHSAFPRGRHPGCPGKGFPATLYMQAVNRAYNNLVKSRGKTWA